MRGPGVGPLPLPILGLIQAVIWREHWPVSDPQPQLPSLLRAPSCTLGQLPHPLLVAAPLPSPGLPTQPSRALLSGCADSAARLAPRCPSLPSVLPPSLSAPSPAAKLPPALWVCVAVSVTQPSSQSGSLSLSLSLPLPSTVSAHHTHTHTHTHTHSFSAPLQQ